MPAESSFDSRFVSIWMAARSTDRLVNLGEWEPRVMPYELW